MRPSNHGQTRNTESKGRLLGIRWEGRTCTRWQASLGSLSSAKLPSDRTSGAGCTRTAPALAIGAPVYTHCSAHSPRWLDVPLQGRGSGHTICSSIQGRGVMSHCVLSCCKNNLNFQTHQQLLNPGEWVGHPRHSIPRRMWVGQLLQRKNIDRVFGHFCLT